MSLVNRAIKSQELEYKKIGSHTAYATDNAKGEHYQTILKVYAGDFPYYDKMISLPIVSTRCYKISGLTKDCKGNSYGTICYHCLGAIIKYFKDEHNESLFFTEDIFTAQSLMKDNSQLIRIVSQQGEGAIWAVSKKEDDEPILDKAHQGYISPEARVIMDIAIGKTLKSFEAAMKPYEKAAKDFGRTEEENAID